MKNYKLSILFIFLLLSASAFGQKLKPEEILAKHLDSIGTKEKRAEIKNMMFAGTSAYNILRSATYSSAKGSGSSVFISEPNKIYLGAKFEALNYPFDEVIYDAKSVETAFIKPGQRSALGFYILNNRDIVREGLFGGTLSTDWGLYDLQSNKAELENNGKKKIDGRETFVLQYKSKNISPLTVKLYFDAETFQHVRTEYRRTFPPPISRDPRESVSQVETVHLLTERFSNFKQVNGITVPHAYQINLLYTGKVTDEIEWKFEFTEFLLNQKIDPATFEIK